jgi:fluoride exporter
MLTKNPVFFSYMLVALGGLLGAVTRFALGRQWPYTGNGWPWATWGTNMAGCFAIGLLLPLLLPAEQPWGRHLLVTGFCGAFTTFSAFSWETFALLQAGRLATAAAYVAASLIVGLLLTLVGYGVSTLWR